MASQFVVGWTFVVICLYLVSAQMYIDNGLDQTIIYRPLERQEKQEIQQELLHVLGLNQRPEPKDRTIQRSAPQYLINLYRNSMETENGDIKLDANKTNSGRDNLHAINTADAIISFVNRIDHHSRHDQDKRFWFDVSDVKPEDQIMAAEFRLYRDLTNLKPQEKNLYNLTLYLVVESDESGENNLQVLESIIVSSNHDGWIVFNATAAIVTWISFSSKNLGLYLQIQMERYGNIDPAEMGIVGRRGPNEKQPFMVAFLQTSKDVSSRRVRSAREHKIEEDDDEEEVDDDGVDARNPSELLLKRNKKRDISDIYHSRTCQRYTFFVSFQDLNWDGWIIAPEGFGAFYCSGECLFPLNVHMNATNHAIVQTLVHLIYPRHYPKPCCAPTRLSSVQVIYLDDKSNVILKKFPHMIVQSCGCQ